MPRCSMVVSAVASLPTALIRSLRVFLQGILQCLPAPSWCPLCSALFSSMLLSLTLPVYARPLLCRILSALALPCYSRQTDVTKTARERQSSQPGRGGSARACDVEEQSSNQLLYFPALLLTLSLSSFCSPACCSLPFLLRPGGGLNREGATTDRRLPYLGREYSSAEPIPTTCLKSKLLAGMYVSTQENAVGAGAGAANACLTD